MKQYYDLEINLLSCLIQKPSLMKNLKLEDKYFIKHQRLWQFMKSFYKKFETFDLTLMYNVSNNKYQIMQYIEYLLDVEPNIQMFGKYQQLLIEKYTELKKEKWLKQKIFESANDLYTNNLTFKEFETKLKEYKEQANKLFKDNM